MDELDAKLRRDRTRKWLDAQIEIGRGIWFDAEFDAAQIRAAEAENIEREQLARLKAKYEPTSDQS